MSDDIVTRLRGKEHGGKDLRCEACDGFCCHCELCDCCIEIMEVSLEAADEIERLRKAYKDLFQIANHAYCFNNFKVLQDNMKENQKTASELGLYP